MSNFMIVCFCFCAQIQMSVTKTLVARSVPTSMAHINAIVAQATTWKMMGTPVKVFSSKVASVVETLQRDRWRPQSSILLYSYSLCHLHSTHLDTSNQIHVWNLTNSCPQTLVIYSESCEPQLHLLKCFYYPKPYTDCTYIYNTL